ncbi:MAG: hypothetical protein RMZ69_11165 [Nostoc sp. ChiQUE01a]|nr:hypothetical protein [Nostoc sp. ChiQUE01a]
MSILYRSNANTLIHLANAIAPRTWFGTLGNCERLANQVIAGA